MPEPTSTSAGNGLAALAIAIAGPMAGPYALIVFAALAGALWPLSEDAAGTRRAGAWLMLRVVAMAVVFASLVAHLVQKYAGIDPDLALAPIAFAFGALGNGWRPVLAVFAGAVRAWADRSRPPIGPGAGKPGRGKP